MSYKIIKQNNEPCRKTFKDLKIDYIKKYGIINIWKDYCESNGHILYRERSVVK